MFKDRTDAGKQLARRLAPYRGQEAIVLALPRGGVVVGYEVAKALELPFDIVVVRKVGYPGDPELALCAVDEKGMLLCDKEASAVDQEWLKKEIELQRQEAMRRIEAYRGKRKPVRVADKIVIVVDDGIATGLTMRLAVRSLAAQHPKKIIVAVPVASGFLRAFTSEGADEVIVLEPPEEFVGAVGAHYKSFEQVEDREVISLLQRNYNE